MAPRAASKTAESSDKVGVICRALRRAIIEQALEPGAKLPEDLLGERFGVSRTIARACAGPTGRGRPRRAAPQPDCGGGDAELAGSARCLRYPDRARTARGAPARRQADEEPDRRTERPCRRRGPRPRRLGRGVDPARDGISHPARQHDEQPDPGALRQRGRLSLLPDAVARTAARIRRNARSTSIARSSRRWSRATTSKVMGLMHSHLDSVANRALVAPAPQRGRDLLDILAPYAEEGEGGRRGEDCRRWCGRDSSGRGRRLGPAGSRRTAMPCSSP